MKKILLGLLFVSGLVNCENLPTYQDYLKVRELSKKMHQTKQALRAIHAAQKMQFITSEFHGEVKRCEAANDCEKSIRLMRLFEETLQTSEELREANKASQESPEGQELQKFRDYLNQKIKG